MASPIVANEPPLWIEETLARVLVVAAILVLLVIGCWLLSWAASMIEVL